MRGQHASWFHPNPLTLERLDIYGGRSIELMDLLSSSSCWFWVIRHFIWGNFSPWAIWMKNTGVPPTGDHIIIGSIFIYHIYIYWNNHLLVRPGCIVHTLLRTIPTHSRKLQIPTETDNIAYNISCKRWVVVTPELTMNCMLPFHCGLIQFTG